MSDVVFLGPCYWAELWAVVHAEVRLGMPCFVPPLLPLRWVALNWFNLGRLAEVQPGGWLLDLMDVRHCWKSRARL